MEEQLNFNYDKLTNKEIARYMLLSNYFRTPRVMTKHNKDLLNELQDLTFRALKSYNLKNNIFKN